ncbi:indoleamine 2,3-dioxygenase 2-like [Watersipora subatra]|uniref:indoleamine 2,3-dioxygenase 2-like n=1 Tax=Watersipora subatra TaxID=2589382 RepID=UPI00355C0578
METEQDYISRIFDQYMISDTYGFLHGLDLPELPEKFRVFQNIARNLSTLLEKHQLRSVIDPMPVVSTADLTDYLTMRHAHLVFALLTRGYIWQDGEDGVPPCIPEQLAVPLMDVSKRAEIQPVICHTDMVLTNYIVVDPAKPLALGNMKLRYRLSGDESCDWFFLVTVGVELEAVDALSTILKCQYCIERGMTERVVSLLTELSHIIERIRLCFVRMHEQLDATMFYDVVRPYLNGWHEKGMIYAGVSDEPIKVYGGSAAQCSSIQALDMFLGIHHEPDKRAFLLKMREYMPPIHSQFLEMLEVSSETKSFVQRHQEDKSLCKAYNSCVQGMVAIRSSHIQMVVKYVTIPAAKSRGNNYNTLKNQGTGGQNLVPFLKNIRSTTQSTVIGSGEE